MFTHLLWRADIVQALAAADLRRSREEAPSSITLLAGFVRSHRADMLGFPPQPPPSPPLPSTEVRGSDEFATVPRFGRSHSCAQGAGNAVNRVPSLLLKGGSVVGRD